MIRSLALTVSLVFVGAGLALAQTHTPSHAQERPHDQSGHTPVDASQHAAMHPLLLGHWTGTSHSLEGASSRFDVTVANDKQGNVTLKMDTDEPVRAGAASHVTFQGSTVHWTQDISGTPCQVSADVSVATALVPDTMKGSMTCGDGDITFALQKAKK